MSIVILLLCLTATSFALDLEKVDLADANWKPTIHEVADVIFTGKINIPNLLEREFEFPFYYSGSKKIKNSEGKTLAWNKTIRGGNLPEHRPIVSKDFLAWLYVLEIGEEDVIIRCVIREKPEEGRIIYEQLFRIPWNTKRISIRTEKEEFEGSILLPAKK